ncbi:MAG: hypothetical protein ACRDLR_05910, partial [Gaiellaceae bacterium]
DELPDGLPLHVLRCGCGKPQGFTLLVEVDLLTIVRLALRSLPRLREPRPTNDEGAGFAGAR